MPVLSAHLNRDSVTLTRNDNKPVIRMQWIIMTDNPQLGPASVEYQATQLPPTPPEPAYPPMFATYDFEAYMGEPDDGILEQDARMYLRRRRLHRSTEGTTTKWSSEDEYLELDVGNPYGDPSIPNPLNRPVQRGIEIIEETETKNSATKYVFQDPDWVPDPASPVAAPVRNSAQQDYDETIYESTNYIVFVQRKNYPDYAYAADLANYAQTVNNDELIIPGLNNVLPFYAKFVGVHAPIQGLIENNVEFYPTELRIAIGRKPWFHEVADRGWQELKNPLVPNDWRDIVNIDEDGNKVRPAEPSFLNGSGLRLPVDNDPIVFNYLALTPTPYAGLIWT